MKLKRYRGFNFNVLVGWTLRIWRLDEGVKPTSALSYSGVVAKELECITLEDCICKVPRRNVMFMPLLLSGPCHRTSRIGAPLLWIERGCMICSSRLACHNPPPYS
jgi:hypothetical protein